MPQKRQPRTYTADHPMVATRTGDPARGAWEPRSKDKRRRRPRRRR